MQTDTSDSDEYFAMGSWVESCIKGFELSGWDVAKLFAATGIDPLLLKQPRCPAEIVSQLFSSAETLFKTCSVGVDARRGITPVTFHAISLAAMASANLWDGLQQMVRFNACITNVLAFSLTKDERDAIFAISLIDGAPAPYPLVVDAVLTTTIKTCRFIQPQKPAIHYIEMGRPEPEDTSAFTGYFKAPLHWNADRYAIHFDTAYLAKPSMHFNADLLKEYERMCFSYFPHGESMLIAEQVRHYLQQHLQDQNLQEKVLDLATVAEALEISERSLQRHLTLQHTSFRHLLDQALQEEAQHLLKTTSLTIAQVAHMLGFNDSSNFSRAFKRWFKCSPNEYRQLRLSTMSNSDPNRLKPS